MSVRFCAVAMLLFFSLGQFPSASAQQAFYTFTSGPSGDGFVWDDSFTPGDNNLGEGETFISPDGVYFYNYTGNISFFDDNYQAAGNSGLIAGDAWWGNPLDSGSGQLGMYFEDFSTNVETVSFDFSWALAGQDAPTEVLIEVIDYLANEGEGAYASFYADLGQTFNAGGTFGGFQGAAEHLTLDIAELFDDNTEAPLTNISELYFYLDDIVTFGGTGEFAIDNLSINDGGTGGEGSNVFPYSSFSNSEIGGISTNRLRGTSDTDVVFDVKNDGSADTTFTATLDGSSNPNFVLDSPATNQPILVGEAVTTGTIATLSSTLPSGLYESSVTITNDLNPLDPSESIPYDVTIYDPPDLSDNSATTVEVDTAPTLHIANAPAGPHAGAIRAGVEATSTSTSGPFAVTGLDVGTFVAAGETQPAVVSFDRYGRLTASYTGTHTVDLEMNSAAGSFLNGAQPVPSVEWDLLYSLADIDSDSATLNTSDSYHKTIGVNKLTTAATLIDGSSPTSQTVTMAVTTNPDEGGPPTASLATDVVALEFSNSSGLQVLQFTYLEAALPGGVQEADLRLLTFDIGADEWVEAIAGNSDGGVGSAFYNGSYADYLASVGGGVLDPDDLSTYGIDTTNNMVWAVLDHATDFAVGVLEDVAMLAGDYNHDGQVDLADFAVWRDHLGAPAGTLPNDPNSSPIGAAQYTTWKQSFGAPAASFGAQQVPEPAAGTAGGVAILLATLYASRRRGPRVLQEPTR